ncbi:MAG: tryptophan-rich sensory protein [Candidatus Omnitrophica bacterium]|nr:tryptophan-rich sensory protein [Candidatus Omnitrophota bacterium]
MNEWYNELNRPLLAPPDWVFGPVWSILYVMIALSIILFIKKHKAQHALGIYFLITAHLISNFIWTWIFFGLKSPGLALGDIIFMDISLIIIIRYFWRQCRISALLLLPYLVWIIFATYLNTAFFLIN